MVSYAKSVCAWIILFLMGYVLFAFTRIKQEPLFRPLPQISPYVFQGANQELTASIHHPLKKAPKTVSVDYKTELSKLTDEKFTKTVDTSQILFRPMSEEQADDTTDSTPSQQQYCLSSLKKRSIVPWNKHSKSCIPKRHVVFLKVKKCGSTTLSSVILRYGLHNNLKVALPTSHSGSNLDIRSLLDRYAADHKKFDIMANHAVYNPRQIHQLTPGDTFFIGILREPLDQFKSAYNFNHVAGRMHLEGKNQLKNLFKHYPKWVHDHSNSMSRYLGLKIFTKEATRSFIQKLEKDVHFFVILEQFDECLILLKRLLCWEFYNIVYTVFKNGTQYSEDYIKNIRDNMDPYVVQSHRKRSQADYILYDYYKNKLAKLLQEQDSDFYQEVDYFKALKKKISEFCQRNPPKSIGIPPSKWGDGFTIFCPWVTLSHGNLMQLFKLQEKEISSISINSRIKIVQCS
ncbi:galactosylceramide sulfotransferase [Lingula anatina]|uniref:Galactosylceramide sulfotransferase n=1 Tax=Lingula anatina TaxID=7574 RepID=A0A1S3I1R4_LINAN|nr:galactosylceramide sulfotransferase [Lingula anatina]|eukprot:XP_013392188.1 galactosylceramide sulfotransferase [Lingula anatina]